MTITESLLLSLAKSEPTISWKTTREANGSKLFSHFLVGFHTRYEKVISIPIPIDYWDLFEKIILIDKEPVNNFRTLSKEEKANRILEL